MDKINIGEFDIIGGILLTISWYFYKVIPVLRGIE